MAVPAMDPDETDDDARNGRVGGTRPANWGIAFDLGLRLGISIILGLGGGLILDSWLQTSPLFTLVGMVLGIAAAMVTIWRVARDAMRR
jgi:F0F1-type ATP synthase assembly protein I